MGVPPPPPGTNPDSHTSQVDAIYGVQNCIKDFDLDGSRSLDIGLIATSV